jgi:hypothetical protein
MNSCREQTTNPFYLERSYEMNSRTQEPGTPVIVKMGGNAGAGSPICIESDEMPFDSAEERWKDADSISTGRICELMFNDGDLRDQICAISARPEVLASLEVHEVKTGGSC